MSKGSAPFGSSFCEGGMNMNCASGSIHLRINQAQPIRSTPTFSHVTHFMTPSPPQPRAFGEPCFLNQTKRNPCRQFADTGGQATISRDSSASVLSGSLCILLRLEPQIVSE